MSQQAVVVVADSPAIEKACHGWVKPLPQPRIIKQRNPFSGEITERKTLFPAEHEEGLHGDAATVEEVCHKLQEAQPFSQDVTITTSLQETLNNSQPFLMYTDGFMELIIWRVKPEDEDRILGVLNSQKQSWEKASFGGQNDWSVFIFPYSF